MLSEGSSLQKRSENLSSFVEAAGMLLFALEAPPKFLLMRHRDRWDLPKGHAEAGEAMLETALRETEEETGIAASSIRVDQQFQYVTEYRVRYREGGERLKRVTYFLGYLTATRMIALTEHESFLWWAWPQLDSVQVQTIDPLLAAAKQHFTLYPERLSQSGLA